MAYVLGAVAPFVKDVAELLGPQFKAGSVGGWRATSSTPGSDHPKGLALDFMGYTGDNKANGDKLAAFLTQNAAHYQVAYVIWQQKIWTVSKPSWAPMASRASGPGEDANHLRHVHVSFKEAVKDGRRLSESETSLKAKIIALGAGIVSSGGVPQWLGGQAADAAGDLKDTVMDATGLDSVGKAAAVLTSGDTWKRVVMVWGGISLVATGFVLLNVDSIVSVLSPGGKVAKVAKLASNVKKG